MLSVESCEMEQELVPAELDQAATELTVRDDAGHRLISAAEFRELTEVPAVAEWLADIDKPNTRRACRTDVGDFMSMLGIEDVSEFQLVRRAHVIAWRKMLEARGVGRSTRRRKLGCLFPLPLSLQRPRTLRESRIGGQAAQHRERI